MRHVSYIPQVISAGSGVEGACTPPRARPPAAVVTFPMAVVPFLSTLNVLWCCWDQPNRQCLHDKVVSSVVVKQYP